MSDAEASLLSEVDGAVGVLTLSRPGRRNALSPDMLVELARVLGEWREADRVRCVVIRGAGERAFSAGFDVHAIPTNPSPEMERAIRESNPLELGLGAVRDFPYPVIAMIRGACFGAALHLAMCCDLRCAGDDVASGMPPARLGLVYPAAGVARFLAVLGSARAREVFFTARTYRGAEALGAGLVDHVFPAGELEERVFATAREIAANAPLSLRGLKRVLRLLEDSAPLGADAQAECDRLTAQSFSSADAVEGQMAFLEKRAPRFSGR